MTGEVGTTTSLFERSELGSMQPLKFILNWAGATPCGCSTSGWPAAGSS
jgi:hypothetical protein